MVKRRIAERQNTDVYMPQNYDWAQSLKGSAKNIQSTLNTLVKKRDDMKMSGMLADANLNVAKFTAQWQKENINDPTNPDAIQKLKDGYEDIFSKGADGLSLTSRPNWNATKARVLSSYMQSNIKWAAGQSIKNATADVNYGIKSSVKSAYDFGASGVDLGLVRGSREEQAQSIRSAMKGMFADSKIEETIDTYNSDFAKSYFTGAIYADPEKIEKMMSGEVDKIEGESEKDYLARKKKAESVADGIKNDIGSEEAVDTLKNYIQKRKREIRVQTLRLGEEHAYEDVNNLWDENVPFSQKLASIDEKKLQGIYTASTATAMKRVLNSRKSEYASTNGDARIETLQRVSDVVTRYASDWNSERFLKDVRTIMDDVLDLNASGKYSSKEIMALNNQMATLTTKSISRAIKYVSNNAYYGDAIKHFKHTVPSTWQSQALFEFFTEADMVNGSSKDNIRLMNEISEKIAIKVRDRALDAIGGKDINAELRKDKNGSMAVVEVDDKGKPIRVIREV